MFCMALFCKFMPQHNGLTPKITHMMKIFTLLSSFVVFPAILFCQSEYNVTKADDAFHKLIPSDVKIERIDYKFTFTEGPVWNDKEKYWLFSDIRESRIYKLQEGKVTVYREPSGNSNGLSYDNGDRLIACEHTTRAITQMDKGKVETVVATYKGKRLNSPNDLVIHSSGVIFFTDPPYGLPKNDNDSAKELPFNGVFLFRNGDLRLVDSTLIRPNGIALSPDEKYLFVANNQISLKDGKTMQRKSWFRYTIAKDFKITDKNEFLIPPDMEVQGNPDGMKIDKKGNFYCTGPGGLLVFNKEGKYLGLIKFPEIPTNCAFGGDDKKTLLVTARGSVYQLRVLVPGK